MAKIDMAAQFNYTTKVSNEELKKIQRQYSYQEMARIICLIVNEHLSDYFKDENLTGICDVDFSTAVLAIDEKVVF